MYKRCWIGARRRHSGPDAGLGKTMGGAGVGIGGKKHNSSQFRRFAIEFENPSFFPHLVLVLCLLASVAATADTEGDLMPLSFLNPQVFVDICVIFAERDYLLERLSSQRGHPAVLSDELSSHPRSKRSNSYSPWTGKKRSEGGGGNSYSPWVGKRSSSSSSSAASGREGMGHTHTGSAGSRNRPKKFLPWVGKRAGETKNRGTD